MGGMNDFDLMFNNFLKSAENIVTHFDDDKEVRNKLLQSLETHVKNNCFQNLRTKMVANTMREILNNIDDNSNTEDVMKSFNEKKQELLDYQPDASQHPNFQEYCRQVKQIVDNADGVKQTRIDDDDIEMTQSDVNVIDPFTKKRMTDPVKNKLCGHIYERDSVTAVLQKNKNTRCPVVGCSNKNPIDMDNIFTDIITRKYIHDNPA